MTNFSFKPFFFFAICVLLSLPNSLVGQDDKKGGIFDDRATSASSGGNGRCAMIGDGMKIVAYPLFESNDFPCDIWVGLTTSSGYTHYEPFQYDLNSSQPFAIFDFSVSIETCTKGFTYTLDLYCRGLDGTFSRIVPCASDIFDDILPDELEDECSLAVTKTRYILCCSDPYPTPEGPNPGYTHGRNDISSTPTYGSIFSMKGRLVHSFTATESSNIGLIVQQLDAISGIYIVTLKNGSSVTTEKYYKN